MYMNKNELEQKLGLIQQNTVGIETANRTDSCYVAVLEETVYKNPFNKYHILSRGQGVRVGTPEKGWDPAYKFTHDVYVGLIPRASLTAVEEWQDLYIAPSDLLKLSGDHPLLCGPCAYNARLTWKSKALKSREDAVKQDDSRTPSKKVYKPHRRDNIIRFSLQDGSARLPHTSLQQIKNKLMCKRAVVAVYNPFPAFYEVVDDIEKATYALYDAQRKQVVMTRPAYPHLLNIVELGTDTVPVYPRQIDQTIYFGYGVPMSVVEMLAESNMLEWDNLMDTQLRPVDGPPSSIPPVVTLHKWDPAKDLLVCANMTGKEKYASDANETKILRRSITDL